MKRHAAVLLFATMVAGCQSGPNLRTWAPAQRPDGIACAARLNGRPDSMIAGELLALQDSAMLLLTGDRIWLVPYHELNGTNCREAGPVPYRGDTRRLVTDRAFRHIQLSRFPQGVSPALLAQLLAAHGQDTLYVLSR